MAALFIVAQAAIISVCWTALKALDVARAYVANEAHYSKAEKAAVSAAHQFISTGEGRHYDDFVTAIAVPQGDRAAREALERPNPDYPAAERGFVKAHLSPADVSGMSLAFVALQHWQPFAAALAEWRQSDALCAKLTAALDDFKAKRAAGAELDLADWHTRIDAIDRDLTKHDDGFTANMSRVTQTMRGLALALLILGSAALIALAIYGVWRISRVGWRSDLRAGFNEQRFRQFADIASDWLCELDANYRISYLSERFQEATGVPAQSVMGHSWPELADRPWLTMQAPTHFEDLREHRPFRGHVMRQLLPDGTERSWSISGTPMFDDAGDFTGYRAAGYEITELVNANRKLQEAHDLAARASVAKSSFLANMSHELRTPLNAIIGFSEVMKEKLYGPLGNDHYETYVEHIRSSGRHLLSLINDILDLSRIEAGKLELRDEQMNVSEVIESAVSLCRERAERADVDLGVDLHWSPVIKVDTLRLKQILINLISNATKFTPAGGHVVVETSAAADGGLAISVKDTGIGMSKEEIETALKPFGQVDNGLNRKYEGSGLGLPLSKTLTEIHGGTFAIESKPGTGTTVTITLPASRVRDGAPPPSVIEKARTAI